MSAKDCGNHGHHHHRHKLYRELFALFLGFVVLVLFVILVIWLVLRPTKPRFYLQGADVYQFNRSSADPNLLSTTIQITVSSRNPNDRIGVYYDRLDAYASYMSQQITLATAIPPTYQGHNDVNIWSPFLYSVSVPIAPFLSSSLGQDQNAGLVLLYIKIQGRLRWKVGTWTSGRYHIYVNCPALLTFDNGGGGKDGDVYGYSPTIRFQQITQCTVDV